MPRTPIAIRRRGPGTWSRRWQPSCRSRPATCTSPAPEAFVEAAATALGNAGVPDVQIRTTVV